VICLQGASCSFSRWEVRPFTHPTLPVHSETLLEQVCILSSLEMLDAGVHKNWPTFIAKSLEVRGGTTDLLRWRKDKDSGVGGGGTSNEDDTDADFTVSL